MKIINLENELTQQYLTFFIYIHEGAIPVGGWELIGIHRILWRENKRPYIIFKVSMALREWLSDPGSGYVEILYNERGPLDNPYQGEKVCTIRNIQPKEAWIKDLNKEMPYYNADRLYFYFSSYCDVEWHIFELPELKEKDHDDN